MSHINLRPWYCVMFWPVIDDQASLASFAMIDCGPPTRPLLSVNPHAVSMPHALLHLFYSLHHPRVHAPPVQPKTRKNPHFPRMSNVVENYGQLPVDLYSTVLFPYVVTTSALVKKEFQTCFFGCPKEHVILQWFIFYFYF